MVSVYRFKDEKVLFWKNVKIENMEDEYLFILEVKNNDVNVFHKLDVYVTKFDIIDGVKKYYDIGVYPMQRSKRLIVDISDKNVISDSIGSVVSNYFGIYYDGNVFRKPDDYVHASSIVINDGNGNMVIELEQWYCEKIKQKWIKKVSVIQNYFFFDHTFKIMEFYVPVYWHVEYFHLSEYWKSINLFNECDGNYFEIFFVVYGDISIKNIDLMKKI